MLGELLLAHESAESGTWCTRARGCREQDVSWRMTHSPGRAWTREEVGHVCCGAGGKGWAVPP